MMKIILASALIVMSLSSTVSAFPNAQEMQQNFNTCVQSDESWMRRFGQYLVSFDLGEAADVCNSDPSLNGPAQVMACRSNGQWLYAGYYCSDPY
jgi:hypothetical protein